MKLTLLFLLSFSLSAQGQKDTTPMFRIVDKMPRISSFISQELTVRIVDKDGVEQSAGFTINPKTKDSVFFVQGDTATVLREFIKAHFQMIAERNKKEEDLRNTIESGIHFLNDLPAYYKNKTVNPSWPEYLEQLSRQGV